VSKIANAAFVNNEWQFMRQIEEEFSLSPIRARKENISIKIIYYRSSGAEPPRIGTSGVSSKTGMKVRARMAGRQPVAFTDKAIAQANSGRLFRS